ncbi:hypothetical protein FF38_06032 [Lucilia cuprina]|uniref:Uncharacterized protein n=1 Tax=Lucilia cuprina TaxID=7375 RepID=A0A0L0C062_LUCCU|nr:hypothetical protein FF38_06032 [Lucilia cuprina]
MHWSLHSLLITWLSLIMVNEDIHYFGDRNVSKSNIMENEGIHHFGVPYVSEYGDNRHFNAGTIMSNASSGTIVISISPSNLENVSLMLDPILVLLQSAVCLLKFRESFSELLPSQQDILIHATRLIVTRVVSSGVEYNEFRNLIKIALLDPKYLNIFQCYARNEKVIRKIPQSNANRLK